MLGLLASAKIIVNINSATIENFSREPLGCPAGEAGGSPDPFRSVADRNRRVHQLDMSSTAQAARITSISSVPENEGMRVTVVN